MAQIEGAINALHSKKKEWANLGCKERASLLRKCVETTLKVHASCHPAMPSQRTADCGVFPTDDLDLYFQHLR